MLIFLAATAAAGSVMLAPGSDLDAAVDAAADNDTLLLSEGTYTAPRSIDRPLTLRGVGAVTLRADSGIALGSDVTLASVTITGGDGVSAALRSSGTALTLRDVIIEDYAGDGLSAEDAALSVSGGRIAADGAAGRLVDTDAVLDGVVVQGVVPGLAPSYLLWVSGGQLELVHTTVTGAHRGCLKAHSGAHLSVRGSILAGCGVLYGQDEGEGMAHYAVVLSDATGTVSHSIVNPSPMRPHEHGVYGPLELGEGVQWGVYPGYAGWAERTAVLALTVDDQSRLENAVDIADMMGERGLHMSYFVNVKHDWSLRDDEWEALREMVDDGHDVGNHCATNARLTQEEPMFVDWSGAGSSAVVVSGEGTALSVTVDGEAVLSLDLTAAETDTMMTVCETIDALPEHGCWINREFPNGASFYADATTLADGETVLSAAGVGIVYDDRLPSEGGRRFTSELIAPISLIEGGIGGGYEVVSMGYPGQEHNARVRDAAADAGLHIVRGAGGYATGSHLLHAGFDRMQSPINISSDLIVGADHATLTDAEQKLRISQFVGAWSSMALEHGAMSAVTIHGAEHFSPEQAGWLLDALAETPVQVLSLRELSALLDAGAGTGRYGALPAPPAHDYELSARSLAVDAGQPGSRSGDALGRAIYGAPDLGALEHQPAHTAADAPLTAGSQGRIYADGALRLWDSADSTPAPLTLEPAGGYTDPGPGAVRDTLLDLDLTGWAPGAPDWTMTATTDGDWCVGIGGLAPGRWSVSADSARGGPRQRRRGGVLPPAACR